VVTVLFVLAGVVFVGYMISYARRYGRGETRHDGDSQYGWENGSDSGGSDSDSGGGGD